MFWRQEPSSEFARREAKRINRVSFYFIGVPILIFTALFFSFMAYWFLAPWEITYRHHGATVLRAQIEALPIYNTDGPAQFTSYSDDRLIVSADFPRNESCAPIFDHYRQVAPANGWSYTGTDRFPTDHYFGTFDGYKIELSVYCELDNPGFNITASVTLPLCFSSCPSNMDGQLSSSDQRSWIATFWGRATT
jgi:hypothetical protein